VQTHETEQRCRGAKDGFCFLDAGREVLEREDVSARAAAEERRNTAGGAHGQEQGMGSLFCCFPCSGYDYIHVINHGVP
jgi:hypothetical protein